MSELEVTQEVIAQTIDDLHSQQESPCSKSQDKSCMKTFLESDLGTYDALKEVQTPKVKACSRAAAVTSLRQWQSPRSKVTISLPQCVKETLCCQGERLNKAGYKGFDFNWLAWSHNKVKKFEVLEYLSFPLHYISIKIFFEYKNHTYHPSPDEGCALLVPVLLAVREFPQTSEHQESEQDGDGDAVHGDQELLERTKKIFMGSTLALNCSIIFMTR